MLPNLSRWIYKLINKGASPIRRDRNRARLHVESLEDRMNPSSFNWTGDGGNYLWENAANWDQNDVPTSADDVSIMPSGITIVNQQGAAAAHSIMSCANLTINGSMTVTSWLTMMGGQLTVSGDLTLGAGASAQGADVAVTGHVHLGAGSSLYTSSGASEFDDAAIDGDGKLIINEGTAVFTGASTISNLDFNGGAVEGPGALTITGAMNWSGGNLEAAAGTLNIAEGAALNITSGMYGVKSIDGWTINADGAINWTSSNVDNSASTVNITATGEFNISCEGTWGDPQGDSEINNDGTMNVSAGGLLGMPVSVEAEVNSPGDVNVQAGSFVLKRGGTYAGTIDIAANSDMTLDGVSFTALQGAQATGQGQFIVGSTTTYIIETGAIARHFNLTSTGTIDGAGDLIIYNRFDWNGGSMNGAGRAINNGIMTVNSEMGVRQFGRRLENNGTINWLGSILQQAWGFGNGASIVNNGQFNINAPAGRQARLLGDAFDNYGTVTQVAGQGTFLYGLQFTNHTGGTFAVSAGDLLFQDVTGANTGILSAAAGTAMTFGAETTFTFTPQAQKHADQHDGRRWIV